MSLLNIKNPWPGITAADYEAHMSHPDVLQLQALNSIFQSQYEDYLPETLLYIGICTGNGLEHLRPEVTRTVYGIDINEHFLKLCTARYAGSISSLQTRCLDLNHAYFSESTVDLVVVNLVLEFIDSERFIGQLRQVMKKGTVVSIVFQIRHDAPQISSSGVKAMDVLSGFKREVDREFLEKQLYMAGLVRIREQSRIMGDGKELVRIDFRNT
ncbi:MAG: methyltransferase domain-containing protein [Chlorobiaceae bacterium]|nr:methyltransferase domain-containing protein [Chlorobiaceae bacterium]